MNDRLLLLALTCYVLVWAGRCGGSVEIRSAEDDVMAREEKELIDALQEVLEKLRNKQNPSTEKRLGWVPSAEYPEEVYADTERTCKFHSGECDAGEQCAVRKGARFGKVCTCPGGTTCSFSILKCL